MSGCARSAAARDSPTYPRYPHYPQAEAARFRFCESDARAIVALRDEERISGNGEKFGNAATVEAGGVLRDASHGSGGWVFEEEA